MEPRWNKRVNLADRKATFEALKKLYGKTPEEEGILNGKEGGREPERDSSDTA